MLSFDAERRFFVTVEAVRRPGRGPAKARRRFGEGSAEARGERLAS